jgi:hypothetical protein
VALTHHRKRHDGATLATGYAHGADLAIIRHDGKPVDARQWLNALTLTLAHGAHAATQRC